MEYHEIGERFEYDGVTLEVVYRSKTTDCHKCYFEGNCKELNHNYSNPLCCYHLFRDDNNDVYYKLVEQRKTKDTEQKQQTETIMEKEQTKINLERLAEIYGSGERAYHIDTTIKLPIDCNVDHPKHYNSHPSGIECITIARHHNFNIGNAIKYLWRAGLKHEQGMEDVDKQIEDLQKAIFYIKDEICRIKELEK